MNVIVPKRSWGRHWLLVTIWLTLALLTTMRVHAQSPITNTASVTADQNDSSPANNSAAACTPLNGAGIVALGQASVTSSESDTTIVNSNDFACLLVVAANSGPIITQPGNNPASISIPENTTAITDVNTTDDSGIDGNGTLTYTISGPDAGLMMIDISTGVLSFTIAPDFEAMGSAAGTNTYSVTVTVADASGLTDTVAIAVTVSDVADTPDLITTLGQPQPSLMVGVQSNLPVTVTNQGDVPATGPLTTTVTLPAGVSTPATFVDNGWSCTTTGQTVTCVNAGPLANGSSSGFNVPVTAATSGSAVTFNATTAAVSGESNTGNNAATPLTTSSAVAAFADGCFAATVTLNGSQETPPNGSTATGTASVTVNTTANTLDYTLSFSGLTPTGAHIHGPAAPGVGGAGILYTLPTLASPQSEQWSFSEGDQANILGGLTYFNLHTAAFGDGEIRGQIGALVPTACAGVTLPLKVFLGGAYAGSATLMHDDLRATGLLALYALSEPYSSAPYSATFSHVGGGGESIAASVLAVTGTNAIVDWLFLEVRDTPTNVVATRAALLQRDGDVVDVDGVSSVQVAVADGNYYVAVRHRNHLGVMTANPVALSGGTALIDFTGGVGTYGGDGLAAQQAFSTSFALRAGNVNGDDRVAFSADSAIGFNSITTDGQNTTHALNYVGVRDRYDRGDLNLDGRVLATGATGSRGSDLALLRNTILQHPANSSGFLNYLVYDTRPGATTVP